MNQTLKQGSLGAAFVIIGIVILAVTMYVLFVPPSNIAIPSYVVGIGTVLAVIGLGVGLFSSGRR